MTPAMELRKTEYAERYELKLLLLFRRFHGSMQMPTMAAMKPPRRMFYGSPSVPLATHVAEQTHDILREQRG